jgi:hypothetical protein
LKPRGEKAAEKGGAKVSIYRVIVLSRALEILHAALEDEK